MATLVSGTLKSVILLVFYLLAIHAEGLPTLANNTTINSASGNSKVYCESSTWYDICWFVFANYVLHALSVRSLAGENTYSSIVFKLCCLLVPYTGLRRGLCLISRASNLAGNDLQGAARANALCMVIRTKDWRPRHGDTIDGCHVDLDSTSAGIAPTLPSDYMKQDMVEEVNINNGERSLDSQITVVQESHMKDGESSNAGDQEKNDTAGVGKTLKIKTKDLYNRSPCRGRLDKLSRVMIETPRFSNRPPHSSIVDHQNVKIQGLCEMSPGYALAYVPGDVKIYPRHRSCLSAVPPITSISPIETRQSQSKTRIASAHDFPRILFSITQTVSGGYSLFKARGSQVEHYGYAAYGLTVVPYIVISIINLVGSLLTSEYETVYLVHSSIMDEMIGQGGIADGEVGTIDTPMENGQELPLYEGEEKVKFQGECMEFHYHDDILHCHFSETPSSKVETYAISPYEAPAPKPKLKWCEISNWIFSPRKPSKTSGSPSVTVPSHPSFTRLPRPRNQAYLDLLCMKLVMIAISIPYIVISVLTGWKEKHSSQIQRNFTLSWIICGQIQGYFLGNLENLSRKSTALKGLAFVFVCYGYYCVSGFYVVAQEMIEFGTCKAM